jgi:MinD-like ATPase involved in chromosome partitioning or flagellar assembly
MRLAVLTAADAAAWEARLLVGVESGELGVEVVRRCVDVVELVAVAISGQARAAVLSAGLRRLDADAVDRLIAAGVVPVGVVPRGDPSAEDGLRAMGVLHLVQDDAAPEVFAAVIEQAVRELDGAAAPARAVRTGRSFGHPVAAAATLTGPLEPGSAPPPMAARRGSVVAVWGPTGAPGRTTVAVTLADELARLGLESLLVDADTYGGVVASVLGLLDDSPGLAAACRQAGSSRLGLVELAELCWQLSPRLRVLTGIPRADRWAELRTSSIPGVLAAGRQLADVTVVDCGFCLEADEELSFDSMAPRRNGVTLALLDEADLVVAVGSADPVGLQRLVRGLGELRDAEIETPVWPVLNRVRRAAVPGDPAKELAAALARFTGLRPAALLPYDQSALDAAISAGRTLAESRPDSALRRAVQEMAQSIRGAPDTPTRGRRRR